MLYAKALTALLSSGLLGTVFHALPAVHIDPMWGTAITAIGSGILTWLVPNTKPAASLAPPPPPLYGKGPDR